MLNLPAKARLADHLIDGGLEALIRAERAKGASFEQVARAIYIATAEQVEPTAVTVQSWASRLGIPTRRLDREAPAAS